MIKTIPRQTQRLGAEKMKALRLILAPSLLLAVVSLIYYLGQEREVHAAPVALSPALVRCDANGLRMTLLPRLPDSRYLYSKTYGWFDSKHFDTGNPAQVIADVEAAVDSGGGIVSIREGVSKGITGYTAHYLVSSDVTEAEALGVALGIYMDWSVRFEAWQGRLPRSLVGPLTSFSIEDLPTQYVGFFAAAAGLDRAEVFACYLGNVQATDTAPPHFLFVDRNDETDESMGPEFQYLTNTSFTPLVPTETGWKNIRWPRRLSILPIESTTGLWQFDSEETWYFNEGLALPLDESLDHSGERGPEQQFAQPQR